MCDDAPDHYFLPIQEEFAANVYWALHHDPAPLTRAQRHTLSWEAATERFIAASRITREMNLKSKAITDKVRQRRVPAWAGRVVAYPSLTPALIPSPRLTSPRLASPWLSLWRGC